MNYGQGGVLNGPNYAFTVHADGDETKFEYHSVAHVLVASLPRPPPS